MFYLIQVNKRLQPGAALE